MCRPPHTPKASSLSFSFKRWTQKWHQSGAMSPLAYFAKEWYLARDDQMSRCGASDERHNFLSRRAALRNFLSNTSLLSQSFPLQDCSKERDMLTLLLRNEALDWCGGQCVRLDSFWWALCVLTHCPILQDAVSMPSNAHMSTDSDACLQHFMPFLTLDQQSS